MSAKRPLEERVQDGLAKRRALYSESRNAAIAGRDLVAIALSNPSDVAGPQLRGALLGRVPFLYDNMTALKRITNGAVKHVEYLMADAARPDEGKIPAVLDAWKLVICDARIPAEGQCVQDLYDDQLREEELQTPTERARESVRTETEKMARRSAKLIVPILERLSQEELTSMVSEELKIQRNTWTDPLPDSNLAIHAIWRTVVPSPPAWVHQILDAQQSWGFVFYTTREVEDTYGQMLVKNWDEICEFREHSRGRQGRSVNDFASLLGVHTGGNRTELYNLWTEDWAAGPTPPDVINVDAVREHFRKYRETLASPFVLRNTFIVVGNGIRIDWDDSYSPGDELPYIWAYDADWEPVSASGSSPDRYRGYVKVAVPCLKAWFYAARLEGIDLEKMWHKAQMRPDKLWICYSKYLEEWDHEPFA